ncbi:universal stress protein [Halobacteriales archaeon Cl-PHB]
MRPILLATDGSEYADQAAARAIDLANERDVPLHVLCVVDKRVHSEPGLSSDELATITVEDEGHDCVATVSERASDAGITVEGDVRHGIPHELIEEYAEEIDAAAIVVGEHGEHDDHLGGVARAIEQDSPREVVVVSLE